MKEGWKYEQMGNVCTFISGYTPAKELLSKSGSIPYYKVSDMNTEGNEVLLYKTSLYLSNAKKIIPQGSVVFPKNGGAIFTNKKRMLVCDSVVDLNTEAIFPNKNIVTTNFLYKLLLSIDLGQFDNGGGLPSINIKKMQSFTIPIPPLPEQECIVSLLDAEFAKIDAIKANAEKQLKDAKALFQSALKDYLTPKEGWEEKYLHEISSYYNGLTYKPTDVSNTGTLVLRSSNIQNNCLSLEDKVKVSIDVNEKLKVHKGDIIMCSRNGSKALIGKVALVPYEYSNLTFGTFMMIIKSALNPYLYFYFLSDNFKKQIWKGEANMINQITRYMLDEVLVQYPKNEDEQRRIVKKLHEFSAKIKSLQSNFDTTVTLCNDLKQSILKDIFG
jgi:type I restriction enzyme S subunit